MKKVICVEKIDEILRKGEQTLSLDKDIIITPSARDYANEKGIKVLEKAIESLSSGNSDGCRTGQIDNELIYEALNAMSKNGSLNDVANILSSIAPSIANKTIPYISEEDSSGLKIIKGNSINYEFLETDNLNNQVYYQEVICSKNSKVFNAGFLTVDNCSFPWEINCDEMYYVILGPLNITVDGKTYTANTGDVVNLPVGKVVQFSTEGKAKMFYGIKAAK
ncbi:MAG: cupin domain-containing protein [Clostridiales Family XIII bacterium]|jgi:ethanolamine utilization protein EutQ|nr:cupin domain-containing protein [Clostridiales Family XIII bacterium]